MKGMKTSTGFDLPFTFMGGRRLKSNLNSQIQTSVARTTPKMINFLFVFLEGGKKTLKFQPLSLCFHRTKCPLPHHPPSPSSGHCQCLCLCVADGETALYPWTTSLWTRPPPATVPLPSRVRASARASSPPWSLLPRRACCL